MRKNVYGRQLKRDANERKALFKGLLSNLVLYERIKTTEAKAKAIRPQADKLITKAKRGPQAQRFLEPQLNHQAVLKIIQTIAPRFTDRNGGYTRLIRLGKRATDGASLVLLEWTEQQTAEPLEVIEPATTGRKQKEVVKLEATVKANKDEKKVKKAPAKEEKKGKGKK
jgi:large subunit ribosomal protein L17